MNKSKEKIERSLGMKLFLKGDRCNSPKCVMVRRPSRPGAHGAKRRRAPSEFGSQLMEKQRIRASYGLREAQLSEIVAKAMDKKGAIGTGDLIIEMLERQFANVVFRLGLANSRIIARQLISHGHFLVNKKKIRAPFYPLKVGEVVSIIPKSKELLIFKDLSDKLKKYDTLEWLFLDKEKLEGKLLALPKDLELPFDINLIVDYYSK
ncbi:30S ribosomal protein S4 [Candidatus Wolfebacteria bacterium]|uniref:Small ribosomal subunit protein uS4 n=1 Tax=Candidatus Wolfebacteria bacterium CG_4_10_14_0_2_um_filter_39_18 TaxID=1975061 RepID=A0A2M7TH11_9BACT|nr:30S ribosomal protein S4 [Candidatus Wolfebacteria bacterium]PIZ45425.1 MAG: 30S ribosomal protein S4 [Candidatus Wolfebacteria bacterium CG_4_10_14_0_2_um_filter_39_18]